jgi:hypothetical protein
MSKSTSPVDVIEGTDGGSSVIPGGTAAEKRLDESVRTSALFDTQFNAETSAHAEQCLADLKSAASHGATSVRQLVNRNPTLALAGLVAVGAIAAIVIQQRGGRAESLSRRLQRDALRQAKSASRAVRDELRSGRVNTMVDQVSQSLASVDWQPYIQPLLKRSAQFAQAAQDKVISR